MIETSPISLMKILIYRFDPVTSVFQQNRFLVVYKINDHNRYYIRDILSNSMFLRRNSSEIDGAKPILLDVS